MARSDESRGLGRLRLRVFPESGCRWPFWQSRAAGPTQPTAQELGLSDALAARVLEWVQYWEHHHPDETAWDEPASREHYLEEAAEIERGLIAELGSGYEIVMLV